MALHARVLILSTFGAGRIAPRFWLTFAQPFQIQLFQQYLVGEIGGGIFTMKTLQKPRPRLQARFCATGVARRGFCPRFSVLYRLTDTGYVQHDHTP